MVSSGLILICEGAGAPVIMGISDPADLYSPLREVIDLNSLFVGIDVSSRTHFAYLTRPDGDKYSSFSLADLQSKCNKVKLTHRTSGKMGLNKEIQ